MEKKLLEKNLWKIFLYQITQRRNFIPILSIYFLTLPNATANQIGIYTGIGYLFSFLFEIPSGYLADRWGHKNTLILSKIFMALSTLSFIIGDSLIYFIFGSIFLNSGFSFQSGTRSAFIHETLTALKRKNEFTKVISKIGANTSLVSVFLIIALPFLTSYDILAPFYVGLGLDIFGLFITFLLVRPPVSKKIAQKPVKSIFTLFKESKNTNFYPFALFTGILGGLFIGPTPFRPAYLESLGYPVILIGFVMGISRIFWFFMGHYAHILEKKISLKKLFFVEIFFFSLICLFIAYLSEPFVVGFLFSIGVGLYWGLSGIVTNYFIKHYVFDERYKATLLSMKHQIELIITVLVTFLIGFVMQYSYKIGYYVLGVCLFILLFIVYQFIKFKE